NQLGTEEGIFVKGQQWDLWHLLGGNTPLAGRFAGGSLVLSRLCPVDYHHFHFPVGGRVREIRWTGRRLYSVSPFALRQRIEYLWENKRCLTLIETELLGLVCFIEVGATNVGSIHHRQLPEGNRIEKGAPKGWFEFGGSSVITIFEPGRVRLSEDLLEQTARGKELYARVGDRMGLLSKA
ncbi:MAG TPA: phosphatidylserine decarboxylase, partial [Oceanipulchritudo sp.]|nr:phosphatidylserine decarboxylase [Oceanipulchritudo sp.]